MGTLAKKTAFILYGVFTLLILGSLAYSVNDKYSDALEAGHAQVRYVVENDLLYRQWGASVGGVYVPISDSYPPNPFLDVPSRDLETTDGKQLTLINPAYMTRKVNELKQEKLGLYGHLTSLLPLNPANAPTLWEAEALKQIEEHPDVKGLFQVEEVQGKRYIRYVHGLEVEPVCLKCHAKQGYQVGDIRGALSTQMPFDVLYAGFVTDARLLMHIHAMFWLLSILSIRCGTRLIARSETRRDLAEIKLQEHIHRQGELIAERTVGIEKANSLLFEEIETRREAEEQTHEAKDGYEKLARQFSTLLNAIPDHIYVVDANLRLVWKNKDFFEGQGHPLCCVARGEIDAGHQCVDCVLSQTFAVGEGQSSELLHDGLIWKIRTFPVTDSEGKVLNVIMLAEEVSKKIRERQENMHVAQLASIGELAASVAHEINNPINGIINLAQVMKNRAEELPAGQGIPARIIKEGERVADIVKNLLNLSRKDDEPRLENISAILSEVLSVSRKGLYHDGIELKVECVQNIPSFKVNGHQIHQVVLNLLANARHAFNDRPQTDARDKLIRIGCSPQQHEGRDYVQLQVWDNAVGIASEVLGKVVLPFYTTKGAGVGTGLGLSICKDIAEKHAGFITVDSVEGDFTEVAIFLPLDR